MPLRRAENPLQRSIDIVELLADLREILDDADDIYLFGSRRFKTGSVRSDIDLLVITDGRITRAQAQAIWDLEPYVDVFYGANGSAQSIVNESVIAAGDTSALIGKLQAEPLMLGGAWQAGADQFRVQHVLSDRSPIATMADLYELGAAPPGGRADILVVTALAEEFRAAIAATGAARDGDRARAELVDRKGGEWIVELQLINAMGSVPASMSTLDALRRTKAPHAVLLGIAAGFPGRVALGDVVIPEQIVYYEGQKISDLGLEPAPTWKSTFAGLRRSASVLPVLAGIKGGVRESVTVHTDVVLATGEKVVSADEFREALKTHHRKVAAIDMEAYGVAAAAEHRGASVSVIKGICDFADATKNDEYHEFAAMVAALEFRVLVEDCAFENRQNGES